MTKFQHNDVVKCIDNTGIPSLIVGMNYPVNTCSEDYVWLDLGRYTGYKFYLPTAFSPHRFELTEEVVTFEPTLDNDTEYFEEDDIEFPDDPDYQDICQELAVAKRLLNLASEKLEECQHHLLAEEINKFLGEE
jgi:hypothetical protein